MVMFLCALAVLIVGYLVYGTFVERMFGTDKNNVTPALTRQDGVDFVPLPTWKVFLIQFLNIAGIGPIFGAIMGVMYGPAAFLWIAFGTIFAGGVHDFISAMISLRCGGKSLPDIVGTELGKNVERVMAIFTLVLLIMVVAVFVRTPAGLLASMTPDVWNVKVWAALIFVYYVLATLLPIDKLIGNLYPIFGASLLFMAIGISVVLMFGDTTIPTDLAGGFGDRMSDPDTNPIFPMMFVSIACGAISGFHATQSPMMARCLKNEKHAKPVFYGAMLAEGVVALVWAAAAIAFTGSYEELSIFLSSHNGDAGALVQAVCDNWLGVVGGILAILGVIAAPITTGDTAMRSARLIIADMFNIDQKPIWKRLGVALPIILGSYFLLQIDFSILWRYFAWSNQTLSIFTLWACSVYLLKQNKNWIVTAIPAMFMTAVCVTYIFFAPTGSAASGIGLPLEGAIAVGCGVSLLFLGLFLRSRAKYVRTLQSD